MKYESDLFWKNYLAGLYTDEEEDALCEKYNKVYGDEFNKIKHLLPNELIDALPLLHDAVISSYNIETVCGNSSIVFDIIHNEFKFTLRFINISHISFGIPFLSSNDWLYDEILYNDDNRFSIEIIAFGDFRNRIYFEFEDVKVEGENKRLPDGYECLDDYYNDPKRAK